MELQYDPVTLRIIWNRLISICDEAETGVMRTAFSQIVREGRDLCCVLLDPRGDSVAEGSRSLEALVGSAPLNAKDMLRKFPAVTLEPGDILVNNDPWVNPGHLNDVCALEPIFHRGKLVALACSIVHWPDIGGSGAKADHRSIFEDGLQMPTMKIAKRGQFNEEVLEIIRQNVRYPEEVMGEFRSQLVGNNLIRTKVIEVMERQGVENFGTLSETILARSEAAMRKAIDEVPDGDYEHEIYRDGIERELTVKVKVSVRGTDIHADYAGSSPQSEWGINSMPSFTYANTLFAVKAAVAPHLPNNSGLMRPVTVSMPVGSVVNPRPRSVSAGARAIIGNLCIVVVYGALAKAIPQQTQAETLTGPAAMDIIGASESGKGFHATLGGSSGMGGRHNGDGVTVIWPPSTKNTPTETHEYAVPALLVERKQIATDSGGPGRYRGGCAVEFDVRIMGQAFAAFSPRLTGIEHPARGTLGGQPGLASSLTLNGSPIPGLRTFQGRGGDRIGVRAAGGGGFGDPLERDPALVLQDVVAELVSLEQAEAAYGVVIDAATKGVDWEGTAALRQSRRHKEQSGSSICRERPVGADHRHGSRLT